MPADIVNLNKFKKSKARRDKEQGAIQNRASFGRTKEEKRKDQQEAARRNSLLDGAELNNGTKRTSDRSRPPSERDGGDDA